MAFADLHTHTNFSDGLLSPKDLMLKAKEKGIEILSITDHDTLEGLKVAKNLEQEIGIKLINGIELSCTFANSEFHLLAYNFDMNSDELNTQLEKLKSDRVNRGKKIVEKLNSIGKMITYDEVAEKADEASITRPHVAQVLIDRGFAHNIKDAFHRFLMKGRPAFVKKDEFHIKEAIEMVKRTGGKSVIAHPSHFVSPYHITKFIEFGVDGIEVMHPSNSLDIQDSMRNITHQFWLMETGGSDYHGTREYDEANFGKFGVDSKLIASIL